MKYVHKRLLLFIFLSVLIFSCTRKDRVDKKENEISQEEIIRNELYIFFRKEAKEYFSIYTEKIRCFYFVFKKTASNDTLFDFSYIGEILPKTYESGYRGFLRIDSLNVAVFDEESIGTEWYKDSLHALPLPNDERYIYYNEKEEKKSQTAAIGWVKNGVFEVLPAPTIARNGWYKYFK